MRATPFQSSRRLDRYLLSGIAAVALLLSQMFGPAAWARAQTTSGTPIRFEGYIRAQGATKWLVGNDLEGNRIVYVTPDTPIIRKKGAAELGAWVIVRAVVRGPGELDAVLIEVDRPAGAAGPQVQFVGKLAKMGGGVPAWWLIDTTPVEVTSNTRITGTPAVNAALWVGAVMYPSGLRAEWIVVLASTHVFEFRGTLTARGQDYRIIDGRRVAVTPETEIIGVEVVGGLVECRALDGGNGTLIASLIRALPETVEARLAGSIVAMHNEADGTAAWDVVIDPNDPTGMPWVARVKVDGNTWVDQSAAVAAPDRWVEVRGTALQPQVYQADRVRVERTRPRGSTLTATAAQTTETSTQPWSTPIMIVPGQNNAEHLVLAYTADRVMHAVWEADGKLYHARRQPNGAWSAAQPVAYGFAPHTVADGNTLHMAYVAPFMGNYEVYHLIYSAGAWSLPVNMAHTTGYSAGPRLALAPDRSLHAVWMDNTPGYWTTYYATWDGRFWSNRPVPSGRGQAPAINAAADGSIYIVWQDRVMRDAYSLGDFDIFLATLYADTWMPPLDISDSHFIESLGPTITSTADGEAHIVWVDGEWEVLYSHGKHNAWSMPQLISTAIGYAHSPRIVVEKGKYLHLAWDEEGEGEGPNLLRVTSMVQHQLSWPLGYVTSSYNRFRDVSLTTVPTGGIALSWTEVSSDATSLRVSFREPMREPRAWIPMIVVAGPSAR